MEQSRTQNTERRTQDNRAKLSFVFSGFLLLVIGFLVGVYVAAHGTFLGFKLPFLEESKQTYRLIGTNVPVGKQNVDFKVFWETWNILEQRFYEPEKLDAKKMVEGATAGMVRALGDPYTAYLPYEANVISGEDLAGAFYGIGIELGYKDNYIAVIAPLADTPAEKVGLQAGDIITNVRDDVAGIDEETYEWTLDKAQSVIRGQERYSKVVLTVFREDANDNMPFEVEIERDEIVVKSVTLEFVEEAGKKVAHLKLSRFGERTFEEWNEAVKQIVQRKSDIDGVVLDMRNNPGGYFDEAIHVVSEFVRSGTVVSQKGLTMSHNYNVTGKGKLYNIPLVVLVNQGSASASEIVAGALRDHLKMPLVGMQTFGKGLVQERVELSDGGGLHVTVAKWVLPEGDWIQEEGIAVEVEVSDDPETKDIDEALLKAIEALVI